MQKPFNQETLDLITEKTLSHYQGVAEDFWEGTKDHDVTQNYEALLNALSQNNGLAILDFGCGPGRDLLYFKKQGHSPIGLDGCPSFCEMARKHSGCEVWQQNFLNLNLPDHRFDGIFANASLFHVPSQCINRVLNELRATLKPNGILFSSNPRGSSEGWQGDRYGYFVEFESYQKSLVSAGFKVIQHYYRPKDRPREEQPWLAVVAQSI